MIIRLGSSDWGQVRLGSSLLLALAKIIYESRADLTPFSPFSDLTPFSFFILNLSWRS